MATRLVEQVRVAPDVLFHVLDDEAVLLHLPTEQYFSLNSVGASIWQLLEDGVALDVCASRIAEKYKTSLDVVRKDIDALIAQLEQRSLVTVGK